MSNLAPLGTGFWGTLLSLLYRTLLVIHNFRFLVFPPKIFSFPIISIGGISAGGTGKTPLTAEIISYLIKNDYTPILISRGYGRQQKDATIVSPKSKCTWQEVGDEPSMLRARFPELWLSIGGDRVRTLTMLLPSLPKKAVGIMDDGFQHRALHRDLDIVTIPADIHNDSLIPAGKLREPLSALKRADIIVHMDSKKIVRLPHLTAIQLTAESRPLHWQKVISDDIVPVLIGPTVLFSGIARPERFHTSAKNLCEEVVSCVTFGDHHIFTELDYEKLKQAKPNQWGTTEKDVQRFDTNKTEILEKLYYLVIGLNINDYNALHAQIDQKIRRYHD